MVKKVIIVRDVSLDIRDRDRGRSAVNFYRLVLEPETESQISEGVPLIEKDTAEVIVVNSSDEAEVMVQSGGIHAVIFISARMKHEAEFLAKNFPKTKVFVFASALPEGVVFWFDHLWVSSYGDIQKIVLQP